MLVDETFADLAELKAGTPFSELMAADWLPRTTLHRYDAKFLREFLVCLASVGLKMRLPGFHPLGCVGEELALHAMIERASVVLDLDGVAADFDPWEAEVFEDLDFEMLFDPADDGIEDTALAARLGIANLKYDEWFVPFNAPRYVHPFVDDEETWKQVDLNDWPEPEPVDDLGC
jgi:hypothetical protein